MNGCTVQCARLKSGQSRWLVGPSMPRILSGVSFFSERWLLALERPVTANVTRCLVGDVVGRDAAPKKLRLKNESAGMRRRSEAQCGM